MKKNKDYLPEPIQTKLEFYNDYKEAEKRYYELLDNPIISSVFLDPSKDKKGIWVIEKKEYNKEYINSNKKWMKNEK